MAKTKELIGDDCILSKYFQLPPTLQRTSRKEFKECTQWKIQKYIVGMQTWTLKDSMTTIKATLNNPNIWLKRIPCPQEWHTKAQLDKEKVFFFCLFLFFSFFDSVVSQNKKLREIGHREVSFVWKKETHSSLRAPSLPSNMVVGLCFGGVFEPIGQAHHYERGLHKYSAAKNISLQRKLVWGCSGPSKKTATQLNIYGIYNYLNFI